MAMPAPLGSMAMLPSLPQGSLDSDITHKNPVVGCDCRIDSEPMAICANPKVAGYAISWPPWTQTAGLYPRTDFFFEALAGTCEPHLPRCPPHAHRAHERRPRLKQVLQQLKSVWSQELAAGADGYNGAAAPVRPNAQLGQGAGSQLTGIPGFVLKPSQTKHP